MDFSLKMLLVRSSSLKHEFMRSFPWKLRLSSWSSVTSDGLKSDSLLTSELLI